MRQHIDVCDVANDMRMTRTSDPNRSFLVLEGDKDWLVFKRFCDTSVCEIKIANGKGYGRALHDEISKHPLGGVFWFSIRTTICWMARP